MKDKKVILMTGFDRILDLMAITHRKKSADYSGACTDPYANLRACEVIGIPAWKGVLIRLMDKYNRLQSLTRDDNVKPNYESIEDTMLDMAVYTVIMLDLYNYANREVGTEEVEEVEQVTVFDRAGKRI